MNPPRTGRPPSDNPRNRIYSLRLTNDEADLLEAAATAAETPVTVYAREAALAKARRQKPVNAKDAGQPEG